jgi:AraC-like DNA-binding protein
MKPNRTSIHIVTPLTDKDCFCVVDKYKTEFAYPIHTHSEFELSLVAQAFGAKRIVGDSISVITDDYDLVLIPGNLVHTREQHECRSPFIHEITIRFGVELFFAEFMNKSQFDSIRRMFEYAQKGLCFPKEAILKIYNLLVNLSKKQGFYAVLDFLTILYELSLFAGEARTLSSESFVAADVNSDSRRVQKVQAYINEHYQQDIRLTDLANLAKMTPTAFSRFFKLRTGKNLTDYIIGTRLGNAARLLVNSTMSISEICYECGFNNISNFNRIFKRRKGISPKEFRKHYKKGVKYGQYGKA